MTVKNARVEDAMPDSTAAWAAFALRLTANTLLVVGLRAWPGAGRRRLRE